MTDRVKLARHAIAGRDEHIAVGSTGSIVRRGSPHFIWVGHNRLAPYEWASRGKLSRAVLVRFDHGERWCWPEELAAA